MYGSSNNNLEDNTKKKTARELKAYDLVDFLNLKIPDRGYILFPIISEQSLNMIYAKRGVGKTYVALNIAYSISCGDTYLKWKAEEPRRVLYIDGEMPAKTMQTRLKAMEEQKGRRICPSYFNLLTPDMQEFGMPDLATEEGQEAYEPFVKEADVIIIDNLSTLVRTGKENEAEAWLPLQAWCLNLRSWGKSVILIHHAGKGGAQRGTSRREDVLDLVIRLEHPDDYSPEQGARFEVHYDKTRNLFGDAAKPFEASFNNEQWIFKDIEDLEAAKVIELKDEHGLSFRDIAKEIPGMSKSRAQRIYQNSKDTQDSFI